MHYRKTLFLFIPKYFLIRNSNFQENAKTKVYALEDSLGVDSDCLTEPQTKLKLTMLQTIHTKYVNYLLFNVFSYWLSPSTVFTQYAYPTKILLLIILLFQILLRVIPEKSDKFKCCCFFSKITNKAWYFMRIIVCWQTILMKYTLFFGIRKDSQNLSSASVVIGALSGVFQIFFSYSLFKDTCMFSLVHVFFFLISILVYKIDCIYYFS